MVSSIKKNCIPPPTPEQTTQQGYYVPVALDKLSGAGKTNTVEQITER